MSKETVNKSGHKIDYRFKLMYFIGMVRALASHAGGGALNFFEDFLSVNGFVLMVFPFASGYFYKDENEEHIGKFIWKKFVRIMIPFYLYEVFYAFVNMGLANFGYNFETYLSPKKILIDSLCSIRYHDFNAATWFFPALFVLEVLNILLRKGSKSFLKLFGVKVDTQKGIFEYVYFVFCLAAGLIMLHLTSSGLSNEWYYFAFRVLVFLPAISFGTLYKKKLEKFADKIPTLALFAVCLVGKLYVVTRCGMMPFVVISVIYPFMYPSYLLMLNGFLDLFLIWRICKILTPAIGRNRYVNLIANNSYSIIANHLFGFMVVKWGFAAANTLFGKFPAFDFYKMKTDVMYIFAPKELNQYKILYVIAGFVVAILMQYFFNFLKKQLRKGYMKIRKEKRLQ